MPQTCFVSFVFGRDEVNHGMLLQLQICVFFRIHEISNLYQMNESFETQTASEKEDSDHDQLSPDTLPGDISQ